MILKSCKNGRGAVTVYIFLFGLTFTLVTTSVEEIPIHTKYLDEIIYLIIGPLLILNQSIYLRYRNDFTSL